MSDKRDKSQGDNDHWSLKSPMASPIRRCAHCGCPIDHMAKTAKYCGTKHRTDATRLRKQCTEEIANADKDGGFVPIAMSYLGEIAEELGVNPWDEDDRSVLGILLVDRLRSKDQKIAALEAQLRKLKSQA